MFSDGVFAIVITLLVLELRVPEHEPGELATTLAHEWPSYLAFLVSFIYIGVIWLNHHALFQHIKYMDLGFHWVNLGILLGTVILPFPTEVLADALASSSALADERVAVALYAFTATLMSASWLAAFRYLHTHPNLLEDSTHQDYARAQRVRPITGITLYSVSGIASWFIHPIAGLICIIAMIAYHAFTSEGLLERVPSNG
ncbi:TMEM175 family protein [Streptomyces sp. NPDC026665]|uniref:TMEM175 family protein n=1 Tax=Streptomyces sp. NPDC026665 TaxID=3154798 RepID=UPI00340B8368